MSPQSTLKNCLDFCFIIIPCLNAFFQFCIRFSYLFLSEIVHVFLKFACFSSQTSYLLYKKFPVKRVRSSSFVRESSPKYLPWNCKCPCVKILHCKSNWTWPRRCQLTLFYIGFDTKWQSYRLDYLWLMILQIIQFSLTLLTDVNRRHVEKKSNRRWRKTKKRILNDGN